MSALRSLSARDFLRHPLSRRARLRAALAGLLLATGSAAAETGAADANACDGPALSHLLQRPGGCLAYDDVGHGPVIVLVPGLGDTRGEYRFLAPLLVAGGYRVVSLDLRGHGGSSIGWDDYSARALGGDVIALIRHLAAGPAILVGTSMGAAAVVAAAAEAPDVVSRLVLIGPFVRDVPPASRLQGLLQGLVIKAGFAGPWGPTVWGWFYGSLHVTRPADFAAYRAALVAGLARPGRMAAVKAMIAASKADIEAMLPRVEASALVVMGDRDPDFADPGAEARLVAGQLGARVAMMPGTGHYPQVERPAAVARAIMAAAGVDR